jgi:hypothetical protein
MKTQPASWTTAAAAANFFFTLRALDQHPSWRLHQLVLRIQPSRISLWYLLVHLGVFNRQKQGEKTEISLL